MTRSGRAYKWLIVIFFVGLFFIGSLKAWELVLTKVVQAKDWKISTLVYHRFGDDRYPSTNTSVADFDAQLNWLKKNGYKSLTASEAYRNGNRLDDKCVCITVDDGYRSFMDNALPVLKKYGMKATLFVNTESVGWGDYLSWDELKWVQSQGVEIGNHSHSHAHFVDETEDRAIYFESDLKLAEQLFQKHLGHKPKLYAYPYGEFSSEMVAVLKKRHYKLGFAQFSGVWHESVSRLAIPRFPVSGTFSIEKFQSRVQMQAFKFKEQEQLPIIVNKLNDEVHLRLNYNNEHYPGPVNCFINGKQFKHVKKENGQLNINFLASSSQRRTVLTLTTQNKSGQWCWYSQLIINTDVNE